jgi:hypothetical protein
MNEAKKKDLQTLMEQELINWMLHGGVLPVEAARIVDLIVEIVDAPEDTFEAQERAEAAWRARQEEPMTEQEKLDAGIAADRLAEHREEDASWRWRE